jgi:protein-tyrosine phosphatase
VGPLCWIDPMIDLHSHILPDFDDGADDLEDALEMLRIAEEDGVHTMVATPHMLNGMFLTSVEGARVRHANLVDEAARAGIGVKVLLGAEVHLDHEIPELLRAGEILTLAERKVLLLELPTTSIPSGTEEAIFQIQTDGYTVVLAHPERYQEYIQRPERAVKLHERGVRFQVTARSITGGFGYRAKRLSRRWLKEGLVDVVASDAHSPRTRTPILSLARRWVAKKHGKEMAHDLFVKNPALLLGLPVE